jgi:DNA-binding winged helix-turn-helix (wHTH) protein
MTASSATSAFSFRHSELGQLGAILSGGESAQLIGIGSVGKSNFTRLLMDADVTRPYLREPNAFLFVLIDGNKMIEVTTWGLMELMLHQLLRQLRRASEAALLAEVANLYERATDPSARDLVFRYLEQAVDLICQNAGRRLVFVFDEFDTAASQLPPQCFAFLRALRDDHKYRLMYVFAMRSRFREQQEAAHVEPLDDLVSANTVWLGPHSPQDAQAVLVRLMERNTRAINEALQEQLLCLSGGHPGLLRTLFFEVVRTENALAWAKDSPSVRAENQRIWECFSSEEQEVLARLAFDLAIPTRMMPVLNELARKGMTQNAAQDSMGSWVIFAPLLQDYITNHQPRPGERIFVDLERHLVFVDGQETEALSPLEYRLIEYLYRNSGKVCTREEVIAHVYPDEMGPSGRGNVSDGRLDAIVKRARQRVEPVPSDPQFVVTVRGHGLQLLSSGR